MARLPALGPDSRHLYTYLELPVGATAIGMPDERRQTGLWRYHRPRMEEAAPPCEGACPVGNWITRYMGAVGSGEMESAFEALALENPFPGLCGRVCYHPCEEACNRGDLDGSTSIRAVERHLADSSSGQRAEARWRRALQGKTVAVVGAGPAGLSGAYFLAMLGYSVTVVEAAEVLGGIPRFGIPDYRLPKAVWHQEIARVLDLGIETRIGVKVGRDLAFRELLDGFDAVLLATGAHRPKILDLPGEDLPGVHEGLGFLTRYNLQGHVEPGERTLIVGGGNVAVDVTRTMMRLGRKATLLYRRTRGQMPAHAEEIEDALRENACMEFLVSPRAIRRSPGGNLVMVCSRMELRGEDDSGRARAYPIEGSEVSFEADQIVLAVGQAPDLSYLPEPMVSKAGFPENTAWGQTSVPKVFVAGDAAGYPWSVAQAIGSAKRAAIAMDHFLQGRDPVKLAAGAKLAGTMRVHLGWEPSETTAANRARVARVEDLNPAYCPPDPRRQTVKAALRERVKSFVEVDQGLEPSDVRSEAQRCLSCGVCKKCGNCYLFCPDGAIQWDSKTDRYVIDYHYCKGCGICRSECPAAVILMVSDEED